MKIKKREIKGLAREIIFRVIPVVITFLIFCGIQWLINQPLTFRAGAVWGYIIVGMLVLTVLFAFLEPFCKDRRNRDRDHFYIGTKISFCLCAISIVIGIIAGFTSWEWCHATAYRNLITVEKSDFNEDISDESMKIIVDVATADKLGDRTIGTIQNSSWYETDNEWNLCEINGEYYRVSPLNYAGVFEYNEANGIPGYVRVNATNQQAEYIPLENCINYSNSAYFLNNLSRHLRSQYPSYIFGKSFFEVDDNGGAFYVTSVMESTIGVFGGQVVTSCVITDAHTGNSEEYSLDEVPEWVDHVYSLNYLAQRAEDYYRYTHGLINLSKTDMYRTSYYYADDNFAGYNTTITKDGLVFYMGLTPANAAETNIGFITLNPKNGQIKFYSCAGAEEQSAQSAAQGPVQDLGYTASFPTIVNIEGEETYFMLLKDNQGLIQKFALVNLENYSIVVLDDSIEGVKRKYIAKLNGEEIDEGTNSSNFETNQTLDEVIKSEGTIEEIYEIQLDGSTAFLIKLRSDSKLYLSTIKNNYNQVTLKVGDMIKFSYYNQDEVCIITEISF